MAQIPDNLPGFIPDTIEQWRRWLSNETDNVPLTQRKIMGNVPDILDFSISLHLEAQRIEHERNYWRHRAGELYTLIILRREGSFSIRIPFTRYRIILAHDDCPAPPVLPQEFETSDG
jgi:hypothetical protein